MGSLTPSFQLHDVQSGDARFSSGALTLDTLRAVRNLKFAPEDLQRVLATDRDTVQRVLHHEQEVRPDSDMGAHALRLVRLNRALGDVFGAQHRVQEWLSTWHPELDGRPGDLIHTAVGLQRVLAHIESHAKDFAW
ncbi:antitoxin Xre/MbcA/ParS toxin-binding domain-containing protein [Cognatilysobacter bugurensis]|uniref:Antitoxin Xre/MbcA/ParS-like toxin-binding domain-containing protein n=1 Tax=Cognatilysobacter bugurensis TaxID=543356 RepID=A0A918T0S1_9GAMM|nr:antitoxin Xre/MbcA/ParS toxin-binding domain-containing protein [Lysobacter bugurensis]GHA83465.1 hypothetical protein GCM10007067_21980 [Lysobacter bugurensis]